MLEVETAPIRFYDELAELYHLIYEDWPASIEHQGRVLEGVIRARVPAAQQVADVACGIGTQSLALAARGFTVTGSDLSVQALERARREADARRLSIEFRIDDMEQLTTHGEASADVVIACDNAIPHLLHDEQILRAFRRIHQVLRPGGAFIISVRDYAAIERTPYRFVPFGVREWGGGRVAIYQVWSFDGPRYQLDMYFTFDNGSAVSTRVFRAKYYAISIARLIELATEAGFVDVERIDGAFFQPLIVGSRPRES